MKSLILLLPLLGLALAYKSYDGYMVGRFVPRNRADLILLHRMQGEQMIDVWTGGEMVGKFVDFMVAPEFLEGVRSLLEDAGISIKWIITDIDRLIAEQKPPSQKAFDLNQYNTYTDITDWLNSTAIECGSRCQLTNIGSSYEGRPIFVIKVTNGSTTSKPGLYFECGIHAREWIAPATCLNLINRLVRETTNPEVANVLSWYDWYIEPSSNPDGYVYTHTSTRMWRKTRSPNAGSACIGTDPNRNFDYQWGGLGTSNDPCTDIFRGSAAFSEVETAAIRNFVLPMASNFRAYMAIHSYGQYFLIPWSYDIVYPPDFDDLSRVGDIGSDAIANVDGEFYAVGQSAVLLGATAGCSDDWSKGSAGIKFAYTLELRDTGDFGFLLPPVFIQPVFNEVWAGLAAMAAEWHNSFPMP